MSASSVLPTPHVPFLDLRQSHEPIRADVLAELDRLIETGAFTNGPHVSLFEQAFADFVGTRACVGTGSGLDALRLALLAGEIEPGDEVIVPAMTFVATFEAVTQAGGRPVPADISHHDLCLDPDAAAAAAGPRTRFVMPVHLYGQMADMRGLTDLATRLGLAIVEDACQAHGAARDGLGAGASSLAAGFSFYPGKNLGAFGDAGALTTDDVELAETVRALREHGQTEKYRHEREGWTSRLDTIQALVLLQKLPLLDGWNEQRRQAAASYSAALEGIGDLTLPSAPSGSQPVWHLYVVRTGDPDALAGHLAARGISTGRHYPFAPHETQAYQGLGHAAGEFPVAEELSRTCLSLPLFPGITAQQLERVVEGVTDYFRAR